MNENKTYRNSAIDDKNIASENFFSKAEIPWGKSKEEVWESLSMKLDDQNSFTSKSKVLNFSYASWSIAAVFVLLFGISLFFRTYSKTIICPNAQHVSVLLPDNSKVEMNANSLLKYNPYWYRFSRTLSFEGEGYFEVEKGKKFEVISKLGKTTVVGTSFNIYTRKNEYTVTCLTGKVKVVSPITDEVLLTPNNRAYIESNGKIKVEEVSHSKETISWVNNTFLFTATPFIRVIEEIERQYNIKISTQKSFNFIYTGNFKKETSIELVLDLVCKPFGLNFVRRSGSEFLIIQN